MSPSLAAAVVWNEITYSQRLRRGRLVLRTRICLMDLLLEAPSPEE
jgi:hypothetical protein